ncbi:HU family DNA-binding protein [Enterocloster bolteae]|jgi:DNA-binding protein HU-beta|uniref:HU family DNA-binding protein n=2 Tax=Enterocloster bolteae TaxID=208479 RepID=A0A414ASY6_9FIRM|nr:HU family DNA-binding protein [Enterocloster bolteae]ENZ38123.1 hypothetical protein HMPREF1097_02708 [Enterocloster bolteae 90B8]RGO73629.1 HU family DNA-binding protein [Enterocloster bolteae]RHC54611.1 HU family DNA-binding protein [Enterocloster bolteae]DAQ22726.1 MAG TPA: DNA binding protein [Bacteriophage sp.]
MNKNDLIKVMSQKMEDNKNVAEKALAAFMDVIKDEMIKGNKIHLVGFGTFEVTERAEHMGRNPKTGESLLIEASKAPKFKAASALKKAVNGGE